MRPVKKLVVIGNPTGRRAELLDAAVRRRGDVAMRVVPWTELLAGRADLRGLVRGGDVVRIDSPGKDIDAERALLRYARPGDAAWSRTIDALPDERGRVWWPAFWYAGLCRALDLIAAQLAACPPHRATADPEDIARMFDKTAALAHLRAAGVPVPQAIGRISGFDELILRMREREWSRAFVKLVHGSSASGAIALRTSRDGKMQAYTTAELDRVGEDGAPRIYNTRRVRTLTSLRDVAAVVDAIAAHAAHAERWIPKAGIDGRTFDARVLVIAGRARHVVVRLSRTPMTNLHLLNDRQDESRVRARCGEAAWNAMMSSCERAAAAFPQSLHAGVDLLIAPDFKRHAVLEMNAFGDLLPGATHEGEDPYDAELAATFGAARAEVA